MKKSAEWLWLIGVFLGSFLLAQAVGILIMRVAATKGFTPDTSPSIMLLMQGVILLIAFGASSWLIRSKIALTDSYDGERHRSAGWSSALAVIVIMILIQLFTGWLGYWNAKMELPQFMASIETWMRLQEETALQLTKTMMVFSSWYSLPLLIVCIGIIPGIVEEYFFRGVLQPFIYRQSGRKHLAVWLSAFIFSAIHLQFYGFVPRFVLALFFGYIIVEGAPLWLSMVAHAANNIFVVVVYYLLHCKVIPQKLFSQLEQGEPYWALILTIFLIIPILYWLFRRLHLKAAPNI